MRAHSGHMASRKRIDKQPTGGQGISNPLGPRLLSLKEASSYIGLSIWGLRDRVWAGDIPVVRFNGGRKMYVDVKDLDALIEDNKVRI